MGDAALAAGGRSETARVLVVSRKSKALNRNYINSKIWEPALRLAGIVPTRDQIMHAGRRLYASAQLEDGTGMPCARGVPRPLGPGLMLRSYTHLMPQAEDKAKRAVDKLFERLDEVVDDPLCGPAADRKSSDRQTRSSEGCKLRCRTRTRTHRTQRAGVGCVGCSALTCTNAGSALAGVVPCWTSWGLSADRVRTDGRRAAGHLHSLAGLW